MLQLLPHAVIVGFFGGLATLLADWLGLTSWVLFIVWTAYGLFGDHIRSGVKMYLSYLVGILCGFSAAFVNGQLEPQLGLLSFPLVILTVTALLTFLEGSRPLDDVPAYYLGAITFFASGLSVSAPSFLALLYPSALGVVFGWATYTLRTYVRSRQKVTSDPVRGRERT